MSENALPVKQYYVFSKGDEHKGWCILWWKAEGKGYCHDLQDAGLFTVTDAMKGYPDPDICVYVPRELAEAHVYQPKLVFLQSIREAIRSRDRGGE